ncbi:hypothetical protein Mapa_012036 [Marchantia paleacea]|nr:hypothetical protein Mapa_012036 [Marchantia paleacea]
MFHAPVYHKPLNLRRDALQEPLLQFQNVLLVVVHLLHRNLAGSAHSHSQRSRYGSASDAPLLATSAHLRFNPNSRSPPQIDGTDSLGTINLVRTDGHQINLHLVDVDGHLACSLGSIRVEKDLMLATYLSNFLDWLYNPNLVVHKHDRHQSSIGSNGCLQLLEIDEPILLHREVGDIEPFLLQVTAGVKHALVLRLRGDDVLLLVLVEVSDSLDRDVVGFGCSRGEDDFLRVGADELGDLLPSSLHGVLALPPVDVGTRVGISILVDEKG